uniref:ABC transporter n=1 Tax=Leucosporidium scottii TaxID=5278 RepID=A0A0H5G9F7_9BASI|nr:hypothetical protein ls5930a1_00008 [Leucosporidium scottii]
MSSHSSNSTRAVSPGKEERKKEESVEMVDMEKQQTAETTFTEEKPLKKPNIPFVGRKQPRDPYPSLDEAPLLPMRSANVFSKWTFTWVQPLLVVGYQRTLEARDLWKLTPDMDSGVLADRLMENFERRRKAIDEWNRALDDGTFKPSVMRKGWWKMKKAMGNGKGDGKQTVGIAGALSDTFKWTFWSAGIIKVIGDVAQVTSPLVTKALINFGTEAYYAHRNVPGYTAPNVGRGVGLAIGLWLMQLVTALCIHQFFVRSAGTGVLARAALITSIYRKSMVLSGKARITITNGKLVNHVSTDVSRIDFCAGFFHMSWTAPIQLIIIIIILLVNLGVSSLAGIGFLVVMLYPQGKAMKAMFGFRKKAMAWTDKRAKLIQELLGGMRIVKFFAWEQPYLAKIDKIRRSELFHIRNLLVVRAANSSVALSMPAIATVIAFLVYSATGHSQDPAIIFTSLTLFNLLRMPLMMLPMSLGTITDAYNACGRLTEVFLADTRTGTYEYKPESEYAVEVNDADFQWESSPPEDSAPKTKKQQAELAAKLKADKKKDKKAAALAPAVAQDEKKADVEPAAEAPADSEVLDGRATLGVPTDQNDPTTTPAEPELLQLSNVNVRIPKGALVAVVGPVGSGKSSFLQALLGEMKRTRGSVTFGGSVSYAPQQAWMQSCSLKDNILFGQPYDEERYERVIADACLEADFAMLPSGDLTEIGEKGVTLSGGQKQYVALVSSLSREPCSLGLLLNRRVNIARALYYNADVVLLDDPLSAVDAHVGKHLFHEAICGALKDKTRILVTHALHFLPQVDYVICLDHGKITQQGTYAELMSDDQGPFAEMFKEFGGGMEEQKEEEEEKEEEAIEEAGKKPEKLKAKALMQEEERATGSVGGAVYMKFVRAAKGHITVPLLLASLILMQGAQVVGSYWLIWWQADTFNASNGVYMGGYAALGVAQAISSFLMGVCGVFIGYNASASLHYVAINGVMHAPMSFFDTTPIGRIMNSIDTLDNTLNDAMRMAVSTAAAVLGAIILISIVIPYFLPIVAFVLITISHHSALVLLRSSTSSPLSSTALPLARSNDSTTSFARRSTPTSERVYREWPPFALTARRTTSSRSARTTSTSRTAPTTSPSSTNGKLRLTSSFDFAEHGLIPSRPSWLGFRLDFFGALLTAVVAFFGVGTRTSISPSQTGLILSYILTIQQAFSWFIRQWVEVENDMNSVERILHYANELEQEAPAVIEDNRPPADWPANGAIEFKKVVMSYRPELPPVLKGLSLSIGAGEKIGVVGRTGAGKSSIMQALFRIVNDLTSGSIEIDGLDISKMGLQDLREKLAIIPQDALLFNGTLRTNLDPFGLHDDATLWDALKRSWLVDQDSSSTDGKAAPAAAGSTPATPASRFTLDMAIEDEGNNLSVGERSLVSLARALVKDSRIIVLDEATASVDLATDSKLQRTIRDAFSDKTLLIIAHRLRTVIDADRILVMSDGQVAEFDSAAHQPLPPAQWHL